MTARGAKPPLMQDRFAAVHESARGPNRRFAAARLDIKNHHPRGRCPRPARAAPSCAIAFARGLQSPAARAAIAAYAGPLAIVIVAVGSAIIAAARCAGIGRSRRESATRCTPAGRRSLTSSGMLIVCTDEVIELNCFAAARESRSGPDSDEPITAGNVRSLGRSRRAAEWSGCRSPPLTPFQEPISPRCAMFRAACPKPWGALREAARVVRGFQRI
jgi:hypothetical protein